LPKKQNAGSLFLKGAENFPIGKNCFISEEGGGPPPRTSGKARPTAKKRGHSRGRGKGGEKA